MTASPPLDTDADGTAWTALRQAADAGVSDTMIRACGALAATAAVGCGTVLAARRLSGAIGPAEPGWLLAVTVAGAVLVLVADLGRRVGGTVAGPAVARLGLVAALAALAFPIRSPGVSGWLVAAVALLVTAATVVTLPVGTGRRRAEHRDPREAGSGGPRRVPRQRGRRRDPRPGVLRQRFERRELPAGGERVRGRVVVAVAAGARTGYGHLGFCPAFAVTPTVEVTTSYDGVEVVVTAAEVVAWGVRVECRLAEAAEEPLDIPVDVVAFTTAPAA